MAAQSNFFSHLSSENQTIFQGLKTPELIQNYLDSIPYVGEELNRSPLQVMEDRQCHCLDGGLFAALALGTIGYEARIIDLVPAPDLDDDHVLAIFQVNGKYGAVAKSNFVGLRYREPIYRSLRELAMSYFEQFYSIDGVKTLRGFTRPIRLSVYDRYNWQSTLSGVEIVTNRLYQSASFPLLTAAEAASLCVVDQRSYDAGMLGVNLSGLYQPGTSH